MGSIFRGEDSRLNPGLGLWRVCESVRGPITLEGSLFEQTPRGLLVSHHMVLAGTVLYQVGEMTIGVDLRWKQVSTRQAGELGLALCVGRNDQLVLYFPSQREAEKWTQAVRTVALSEDFHTQYEELKDHTAIARVEFAKNRKDQTVVAVKKYTCVELRTVPGKYRRLLREIEISRQVTHPNVGKLIAVYESEACVALVSQYISGGTLLDRLQAKGKLEEEGAKEVATSLLRGIAHLHEVGVIHRDIKLENVLVETSASLSSVIIDFGLAIGAKEDRGTVCGTPGYVAPELLRKQQYCEKVDIYSAGVVLYMLLSGASPFPGPTESAILERNKQSRVTFAGKGWEGVSTQARNLVLRMTESDPLLRITAQKALKHPWLLPT